jgi:polyphosphate kinase 2 (PPK2 family)
LLRFSKRSGGNEIAAHPHEAEMKPAKVVKHCRVDKPEHFRLADHDSSECFGLSTVIDDVKPMLADSIARLTELQDRLYSDGQWAVLLLFQGMDAAGKDSAITHLMSGINPQGCEVHAFKPPSDEERQHDFFWRAAARLPGRGRIGIAWLVISAVIIEALEALKLEYPRIEGKALDELKNVERALKGQAPARSAK